MAILAAGPGDSFAGDFCKALGLKNVVNLDLSMHLRDAIKITIDYFPESADLKKLIPVLTHATFKLVPIKDDIVEITTFADVAHDHREYLSTRKESDGG